MKYSWISDPGKPLEPLSYTDVTRSDGSVDPERWAAGWAARVARGHPPVHSSPLHRHTEACLGEELITFGSDIFPPMRLRRCSVLQAGKHPDDQKYMAFMGFVRTGESA